VTEEEEIALDIKKDQAPSNAGKASTPLTSGSVSDTLASSSGLVP